MLRCSEAQPAEEEDTDSTGEARPPRTCRPQQGALCVSQEQGKTVGGSEGRRGVASPHLPSEMPAWCRVEGRQVGIQRRFWKSKGIGTCCSIRARNGLVGFLRLGRNGKKGVNFLDYGATDSLWWALGDRSW